MKLFYFSILFFTILEADIFDVSIPENDTASYNYADFRIWINDSTDTLKGIYWFMHPNNGDSRNIVDDSIYQSLAVGQNFALMGAHIFNMHMSSGIGDAVIAAISKAANTQKIGDGKIFVYELSQVVRIRTGETGSEAI